MMLAKALSTSIRIGTVSSKRVIPVSQVRQIHKSIKLNAGESTSSEGIGHKPDKWDKRMLVFMGRYPNVEAIPNTVSPATMDKTRNQVRIRINIAMCIMTGLISLVIFQVNKRWKTENILEKRQKELEKIQETSASA